MPPRITEKYPEFYALLPDGKKIMLGEIEGIKTIYDREDFYEPLFYTPTQEYEFTCRWNPNARMLYFLLHGKFPTNNWLRMHGERSCRKKR
jgi:hypothetical protein